MGTTLTSLSVLRALIAQGYDTFLGWNIPVQLFLIPIYHPPLALLLCVSNSSFFVLPYFLLLGHLYLPLGIGSIRKNCVIRCNAVPQCLAQCLTNKS